MRLISANVNGIRAAARRGGLEWLAGQGPDVLCLQEVRATDATGYVQTSSRVPIAPDGSTGWDSVNVQVD